jgi:hypothetical protein
MEERKEGPVMSSRNSTDSILNDNYEGDHISSDGPPSSSVPLPVPLPPSGRRIALFQASSNHVDDENQSLSTKTSNGNETLPAEIILLRREKKISIEIPKFTPDPSLRIHRVYLSTKKYLHLYHEIIGGIYGISSRPELELHHFQYYYQYNPSHPPLQSSRVLPSSNPSSTSVSGLPPASSHISASISSSSVGPSVTASSSVPQQGHQQSFSLSPGNKLISLELVYDPILNLYVITHHIEDKLIAYLSQSSSTPSIQYLPLLSSVNRIGFQEFNTLTLEKQKQWRKFLNHFIRPLLADPQRVERAENYLLQYLEIPETEGYVTPEDSDGDDHSTTTDSDSDDEKGKKKKKRKGKKKGGTGGGGGIGSKTGSGTTKSSSKKGGTGNTKPTTKNSKSKEK